MRSAHRQTFLQLAISFALAFHASMASGESPAPRIACYQIDVHLDVQDRRLSASERITFTNTSTQSVDTLFLHLYPNAFRNDSTTLMTESIFPERIKKNERHRGFIDVERVGIVSGLDLTGTEIISETIMKLPLPEPLLPQGSLELEIEFAVKLPQVLVRMGYSGNDFMIAQWFPKMAVLEKDGTWNAHQYHFNGEFFADFGEYEVSVTLPLEYVVAATGHLVEERDNSDSTKTLVFRAEDVHDFAWAASPDYHVARRMADGIELSYFYRPVHQERAERILDYAVLALEHYGSIFGKYQYTHFTTVDAKVGRGGGAMEYPTLITVPSSSRIPPEKVRLEALLVFHETAHQWWYGMVASNEFEEAWLDEAFAEYSERRALEAMFGGKGNVIDLGGIRLSALELARLEYLLDPQSDPVVKNSWEFRDYLSYRSKVYAKGSLVLESLRTHLGPERMDQLTREYFRRYKFRHPKTADFLQLVNEFTGEDLTFWFEQLLFGTGICDYEVTSIESVPIEGEEEMTRYKTTVELRRLGQVMVPVEVAIELESGERINQIWDGKERWHRIEVQTDSEIKWAIIDPQDKMALEVNRNNNSLTAKTSDTVMLKLGSQCLFWLENLVQWITSF